ncbi:MAG: hypothetical protein CSB13_01185 [Chloroflexi bacterium]|nr:MAG: hypothetical protein CSB13_01185 [Chloroflexota bacterium]
MKRFVTILSVLIVSVTAVLAVVTQSAPAVNEQVLSPEIMVVRAYFDDRDMVNQLAARKEPWEVHYDEGYLVIDVTKAEYDELVAAGFRLEVDEKLTAMYNASRVLAPNQVAGIPGYACYRTVEETFAMAEDIVAQNPTLASWIDIGDSWDKMTAGGSDGYDLMVLKLTNSEIPGPKPKLFIMTAVHAREYTPAELNSRFAEYMVDNYGSNADVTWLLDYHELHLLLQANPDGRKYAETGASWRKNTNQNYCGPTSSYRGADLNRNFSFYWNSCGNNLCSSGNECDSTYRGPSAASEPETEAIEAYVRSIFPDQRGDLITDPAPDDAMGIFLDIHSYSQLVLWSWGHTYDAAPNGLELQTLGRKFAYFNGYEPDQSAGLYLTDGTTDDFAYGELGLAAYTFELGTSFFQDCATFEDRILPDNLEALVYAAKTTRAPYMLPSGPDALDLRLSEYGVTVGTAVTLTASLDDTRFNNQNGIEPTQAIAAAELYVDVPPWAGGAVAVALTAVDGSFDAGVESARGVIETTGLGTGRHIVFVRGQDADGNWGPVTAEFFYVLDPATAPHIRGQVLAADTGLPLMADIQTDLIFQTKTDVDGVYDMQVISGTYQLRAVPESSDYGQATAAVTAVYSQTVQQNFTLYPYCSVLSDDVESGSGDWQADAPWAITTEAAHSDSHSWTDSPGGNYGNQQDVSLTSPTLDLTGYQGVQLNYWQTCHTESGYDYCIVEVSDDNGGSWQEVARFDGTHTSWEAVSLTLPMLDNQDEAQVRFRLHSDGSVVRDGWHVDDIEVRGLGAHCAQGETPVEITGTVTAVDTGLPLEAVVATDTGVQVDTDAATGLYAMSVLSGTYDLTAVPVSSDYISKTVTITAVSGNPLQQDFVLDREVVAVEYYLYIPLVIKE